MAVDYTKVSTYSTKLNAYKGEINSAKDRDSSNYSNSVWNNATKGAASGALIGASFGGLPGAIFGGLFGTIAGGIKSFFTSGTTEAYDSTIAAINNEIANNYAKAGELQFKRNDVIAETNYFMNQSTSSFINTYGRGTFNMLENTISALLDMNQTTEGAMRISQLLGGLESDTIIGDINTRILKQSYLSAETDENGNVIEGSLGRISQEQLDALYSSYVSLEDLGSAYVNDLYNMIVNQDTAIGDSYRQLNQEELFQVEANQLSLEQTAESNALKFSDLFLNMRSSNISNAENMGEIEASSSASGIKASKSSRANTITARLKQDIANASYAILLKSYQNQMTSAIRSGQLQREQVGFQYSSQRASLRRQVISSYNEAINSYLHGGASYAKSLGETESDVDVKIADAKAGEKALKENDVTPNEVNKYIYSTVTAVV